MTYEPSRPPCTRCGRYERMGGLYLICTHCDDDDYGKGQGPDLKERRAASGWTAERPWGRTQVWVEPPEAKGEPGVMGWWEPSFEEEQRRDALRTAEYGEVSHLGQHPGCRSCDDYERALVRRIVTR